MKHSKIIVNRQKNKDVLSMKKFKSTFLFLIFFVVLFSFSNFCKFDATNLNTSNSIEFCKKSIDELSLSYYLKNLTLNEFETKRLEINQLKKEDYDILAKYLMNPEVTKYLVVGNTLKFNSTEQAKHYVEFLDKMHTATFVLRLKENQKPIGTLGFSFVNVENKGRVINISYWLGKEFHKKGYAKEAIPPIVNEIFNNIGNFKFYIDFKTQNIASKKLANDIIQYISQNNSESSKLVVEKFNCSRLDIEEYLISRKIENEQVAA